MRKPAYGLKIFMKLWLLKPGEFMGASSFQVVYKLSVERNAFYTTFLFKDISKNLLNNTSD